MYPFATAASSSSDLLWASFLASQEVQRAIGIVEESGSVLLGLIADADWQAEGVRALHELLMQFQVRAKAILSELHIREGEIGPVSLV